MTSRQLRLLRGFAASSVATVIAAVSHTIGGGPAPHPLLVVALSVFFTPVAALLVGKTPSPVRLSAAVLLSQTVFHVLFVALNATASGTVAGAAHHHVLVLGPIDESVAPDAGMLGAHLVAGVLTILLLARGESVLRAIGGWVHAVLRWGMPQPEREWPVPSAFARTARVFVQTIRVGDLSRRGPPVLSCG